jgi:hypothetical protein
MEQRRCDAPPLTEAVVPTSALYEAITAGGGQDYETVADWFEVPVAAVEAAVRHARGVAARGDAAPRSSTPRRLSREEGRAVLDRLARHYLHVSGEDFVRAWDAGEFAASPDRPDVMRVALLIDLGR